MTRRYELTWTAEKELESILLYIAEHDSVERALHVHQKFIEAFEGLAAMPGSGFKRTSLTGDRIRWRAVFRFLVLYDPESSPTMVLRVLHGARDLDLIINPGPGTQRTPSSGPVP